MDLGERSLRRGPPSERAPFRDIVPPRAVLTELARGFLLAQSDPERAKRFASSFLKEHVGRPGSSRIVPTDRRATVRRGIDLSMSGGQTESRSDPGSDPG